MVTWFTYYPCLNMAANSRESKTNYFISKSQNVTYFLLIFFEILFIYLFYFLIICLVFLVQFSLSFLFTVFKLTLIFFLKPHFLSNFGPPFDKVIKYFFVNLNYMHYICNNLLPQIPPPPRPLIPVWKKTKNCLFNIPGVVWAVPLMGLSTIVSQPLSKKSFEYVHQGSCLHVPWFAMFGTLSPFKYL